MKMTKEAIIKEDGRLLVYYRFGADDTETPRCGLMDHSGQARVHGDAGTTRSQCCDVKPKDENPSS